MFGEELGKAFLDGKNRIEAYLNFLRERNWPDTLAWNGQKHVACKAKRQGQWKVSGWGFYQGSDWQWRWYVGHRCTTCGTMVQHQQAADETGEPLEELQRRVFVP